MRSKVAIIGAGPAGLLLSQLLYCYGIESVVIERQSRDYVERRIRAGILEPGTVSLLERVGAAERLRRDGLPHDGIHLAVNGETFHVNMRALTGGSQVTVYGQTEVTKDLIDLALSRGTQILFEASVIELGDLKTETPYLRFTQGGRDTRIDCDFIAGCDGFHGPSRPAIPDHCRKTFERVYPFGWLGILADVPPCDDELIYSNHERGFALASMRSPTRSRYYVQCSVDEKLNDWPDERIWDELAVRLGDKAARRITRGPSIEKSIAPLRSFVSEPMSYGRLFLTGDAAHIVPPTGAKGLNLAASDVYFLSEALRVFYQENTTEVLAGYSQRALGRVWQAERFSWWLTSLTHRFPDRNAFDRRIQTAELEYIRSSKAARIVLAENYVGLPFD
ncbi:4-hydroxybenzoate 3-monooxygenase [Tardiphaga sp. 619_E2_N8_5]|uniref:4-hydroxybenzoate 3-monooxygenase n=1 Tax=unclassified Tardiphaga TaxID=2631404 RepID=UPI003F28D0CC